MYSEIRGTSTIWNYGMPETSSTQPQLRLHNTLEAIGSPDPGGHLVKVQPNFLFAGIPETSSVNLYRNNESLEENCKNYQDHIASKFGRLKGKPGLLYNDIVREFAKKTLRSILLKG